MEMNFVRISIDFKSPFFIYFFVHEADAISFVREHLLMG